MDGQTRAIVKSYRGEAARLAAEAAARLAPPSPPEPAPPRAIPPVALPEPDRPPLTPEPATNQNVALEAPIPRRAERRAPRVGRTVAWIVLAPWYAIIAAASIGIAVLFIKGLLGL